MNPPFAYYGGKTTIAPWIVGLIPDHRVYTEPFAGSLAVLLAKPRSSVEVVNDLDDDIVNFWRVLRDQPDELERVCALTPYARSEFHACELTNGHNELPDVERARRFWVRCTQGFGRLPTVAGWSTGWTGNTSRASACLTAVERFGALARRLAGCTIERRDAIEVICAFDGPDTLHYLDPPYLDVTRGNTNCYRHDMPTEPEHTRLRAVVEDLQGAVLVSGYPSSVYENLYDGWHVYQTDSGRADERQGAKNNRRPTTEMIWSNRPLGTQQRLWEVV